jgi:hypothetical protein
MSLTTKRTLIATLALALTIWCGYTLVSYAIETPHWIARIPYNPFWGPLHATWVIANMVLNWVVGRLWLRILVLMITLRDDD